MIDASGDFVEALREAVGARRGDREVDVEGLGLVAHLEPRDADAFARGLALLAEHGRSAVIRGAGTQAGLGNPLRHADVALSTERLAGVDEFDAQDGVLHAGGGTKIRELRELVNAEGWELSLDPAGEAQGATLGGTLSTAAIGPRRLGFGAPRDCVLGLDVVLASGERTRCGGRVVKNVTGYDLQKLYTGAFGTLGVIEGAWLRLRPLPELTTQCARDLANAGSGIEFALAAARRYSARAAILLSPGAVRGASSRGHDEVSSWRVVAEFAGDRAAALRDRDWFAAQGGGAECEVEGDFVSSIGAYQGDSMGPRSMRARIAALPSRLPRLCEALRRGGIELVVHPGIGLVYAIVSEREVNPAIEVVETAAKDAEGTVLFESLSEVAKAGLDVFCADESSLEVMRALKQRFDPSGVLNPGRFAGGI